MVDLREIRKKRGMTLLQLADALGVSTTQVHRLEVGRNNMTVPTIMKLARLFGIAPAEFLPGGCHACSSPKEHAILDMFRSLDERDQQAVQAFLTALRQQAKISNDDESAHPDSKTGE